MIKAVGAALIIGGSAYFGWRGSAWLKARVERLRALLTALETLESEVCERLTPLTEAAETLARETNCAGRFSGTSRPYCPSWSRGPFPTSGRRP